MVTQSALLANVPTGLFVAGRWRPASDEATFPVQDPATGRILHRVASATPTDGLDALTAAADAQPAPHRSRRRPARVGGHRTP